MAAALLTVTACGLVERFTTPAAAPAARNVAANAGAPPSRARTSTLTINDGIPAYTNIAVTIRHHSPFVVRGPRFAPHATSVSAVAPDAANSIARPTATLIAAIDQVAIGYRARAPSVAWNASAAGVRRVAASLISRTMSSAIP